MYVYVCVREREWEAGSLTLLFRSLLALLN